MYNAFTACAINKTGNLLDYTLADHGILPEAANPEEMSPAIIAVHCSAQLEATPMPAIPQTW